MKKKLCTLLFVLGILTALMLTTAWAEESDGVDSGTCGDGLTWELTEGGTLTISGTGDMDYYGSSGGPWSSYADDITEVIIGSDVTSIGSYAFTGCSSLTSITIPESVTYIGYDAFDFCCSLTEISFKGSAPEIGTDAFTWVVAEVYYSSDDTWTEDVLQDYGGWLIWIALDSEGNETSKYEPVSYAEEGECGDNLYWELSWPGTLTISGEGEMTDASWNDYDVFIRTVVIDDGATSICGFAFTDCYGLKDITIPSTVVSIDYAAFSSCSSLTSITIPSSVTEIGLNVFNGCTSLTAINVDSGNVSYTSQDGVLFNSDMSELITYPAGKTDTDYYVPSTVTSISDYAFSGCTSLTSVNIPESVTSIGIRAFSHCTSLTNIDLSTSSLSSIEYETFYCCTSLTSIKIPNSVTSIGSYAFYSCTSLTSIELPAGLTEIGSYAFYYCTSLTSIDLPAGLTEISSYTFYYCTSLTSIEIPDSVTSIGSYAFGDCTSLTSILFEGSAPEFGSCVFYLVGLQAYIPANDDTWTDIVSENYEYGFIIWIEVDDEGNETILTDWEYDSGSCGSNVTWSLTRDGTLTISGTGSMRSYIYTSMASGSFSPWFRYSSGIKTITIDYGVTAIGDSAFCYCSRLTSVTIPESVTDIGDHAFYKCIGLVNIEIPSSVTYIDSSAFCLCTGLTSIDLSATGVTSINSWAFDGCTSLISIELPSSITKIGYGAFEDCTNLMSIDLSCTNVEYIYIYAFKGCSSLTSITIPESVTYIGSEAFRYTGLTSITFAGDAPTSISSDAFEGVIAYAYYPSGNDTWTEDVFQDYGGTITWEAYDAESGDFSPVIIYGEEQTWSYDSSEDLTITSDADYSDFLSVSVDGEEVSSDNYTVESGSTIVTLKAAYLATLSVGEHTFSINSRTGSATTTFTIAASNSNEDGSDTGDTDAENGGDGENGDTGNTDTENGEVGSTGTDKNSGDNTNTDIDAGNADGSVSDTGNAEDNTSDTDTSDADDGDDAEDDAADSADDDSSAGTGAEDTAGNVSPFTDDDSTGTWLWASDYIYKCYEAGIITGYEDGSYLPDSSLTRAEAAAIIARAYGLTSDAEESTFSDVSSTHWGLQYIEACVEAGIINGYEDGTYKPDQYVTRVELAKMIAMAEQLALDAAESSFSDVSADHWGLQYIEACVEAGIVNGYTNGTFLPANNVTRAEAAAMIARALGLAE